MTGFGRSWIAPLRFDCPKRVGLRKPYIALVFASDNVSALICKLPIRPVLTNDCRRALRNEPLYRQADVEVLTSGEHYAKSKSRVVDFYIATVAQPSFCNFCTSWWADLIRGGSFAYIDVETPVRDS